MALLLQSQTKCYSAGRNTSVICLQTTEMHDRQTIQKPGRNAIMEEKIKKALNHMAKAKL